MSRSKENSQVSGEKKIQIWKVMNWIMQKNCTKNVQEFQIKYDLPKDDTKDCWDGYEKYGIFKKEQKEKISQGRKF